MAKIITTEQFKGDDITLSITVGTAVNIDDLAEVFIYVINKKTNVTAIKFSKAGTGDFIALIKISTTVYEAIWPSGDTKVADIGYYNIEGNYAITDAEYESSEENVITLPNRIFLKLSVSKASSSG